MSASPETKKELEVVDPEAAEATAAYLRAVLDNAGDFIAYVTTDLRIHSMNRLAPGFRLEEVVGASMFDYLAPESRAAARACCERVLETGEPGSFESVGQGAHGELTHYMTRVGPIKRGDAVIALVLIAVDISEHKRAKEDVVRLLAHEQAARRRASFLAEASEVLGASLDITTTLHAIANILVPHLAEFVVIDLIDGEEGRGSSRPVVVVSTDPTLKQLYLEMRRRYQVVKMPHTLLQFPEASSAQSIACDVAAFADAVAYDAEHRRMLERVWPRSIIVIPLAARGNRLGAFSVGAKDRAFDPEDVALVEEIGRRASLAIDNARLYQQASDAIRLRDEFLIVAAHELRTPLTAVQLGVQGLLRKYRNAGTAGLPAEQVKSRLEGVDSQLHRFNRLIEYVLGMSRIDAGKLVVQAEDLDLCAVLGGVLAQLAEPIRRAHCDLRFETPGAIRGQWDRRSLEQIVGHLISNAIKYGPGRPIEVALEADADSARLRVRDHGIGIDPADHARIFQRFERVSADHYDGSFGLGLWIARRAVEAMGGSIRVDSRLGEGATFTVDLPRHAP